MVWLYFGCFWKVNEGVVVFVGGRLQQSDAAYWNTGGKRSCRLTPLMTMLIPFYRLCPTYLITDTESGGDGLRWGMWGQVYIRLAAAWPQWTTTCTPLMDVGRLPHSPSIYFLSSLSSGYDLLFDL